MSDTSPPPSTRRFSPTPVETTMKKIRRFAPEPVETTTRSSKKNDAQIDQYERVDAKDFTPKRRFLPEPVETTFKSSKVPAGKELPTPEPNRNSIPESPTPAETPKLRRRFAPELIETTTRTKKAGQRGPATLPTDKTDLTPGVPNIYNRPPKRRTPRPPITPIPAGPANSPAGSLLNVNLSTTQIPPRAPFRQQSMRPHPNTRRSTRQNSFHPELEDILSSESEDEGKGYYDGMNESTPSLTGSFGSSDDSNLRLQLARTRESCDDRFSGYLLALAAKAAEKQLREQALAAFPNEANYEIVEHFYDRELDTASDEEVVEGIGMLLDEPKVNGRRKSTEVGWHVKEMQQHQEKLNRQREDETNKKIAAEATKPTFEDPFWTNGMTVKQGRTESVDKQKEAELQRMRSAASPPMLGGYLKFRMCPSPKPTKFESDQRIDVRPKKCEEGGGLWGGYCVAEEPESVLEHKRPAFIHTPHNERVDPGSPASTKTNGDYGPRMLSGLDERLKAEAARAKAEAALLEEFNDTFITQVYNYLSLGYPALARPYDEELARISKFSVNELREDDGKNMGHLDIDMTGNHEQEQPKGARWNALRLYILEWGRQHPSMSNGDNPTAWGVRARRGSWAI